MSHPGVETIIAFLTDSGFSAGTITEQRAVMAASADTPPEPGVRVEPATLGGRPAEWLWPEGDRPDPVILYLHGGGYCIGSMNTHRGVAGRLALAAHSTVAVLDYRLAPEHPFPAAVDDATAAYADLVARGVPPARITIAGDSAGGGLTVATLLALRRSGMELPAAAACLSPWVDLTQSSPSYRSKADADPMVTAAGLDEMARCYLGGEDAHNELASPLFAADLSGLPPVLIEVGDREVLLDDAIRLADRIRDAGGAVALTVWPEMIHVFQVFPAEVIPESAQSITAVGRFLAEHRGRAAGASTGAGG
ncbi:MAG TPA: alpha/beta hydrolase [Acidimicrobiales bacterium]|nr:alpha/beta hydrolase [Acidimicrobiales bacterium]